MFLFNIGSLSNIYCHLQQYAEIRYKTVTHTHTHIGNLSKKRPCSFVGNRSSRFPGLQVRSIWPSQRGHSLSVSPRSREPRLHEGIPEGAQPAVEGAETQGAGGADLLQARLLSRRTTAYQTAVHSLPWGGVVISYLGLLG